MSVTDQHSSKIAIISPTSTPAPDPSVPRARNRIRKLTVLLILCGSHLLFLAYGVLIVRFHFFPYGAYVATKQLLGVPSYKGKDEEILKAEFVDQLAYPNDQLNPPSISLVEVSKQIAAWEFKVDLLSTAYESIHNVRGTQCRPELLRVDFEINRPYSTFAYARKSQSANNCAVLIIPGSGLNQSSAIFKEWQANYHGKIVNYASTFSDVFVYMKPNEDLRAIHDGRNKLSYTFITASLINHGAAYAAYYVAETLALTKYLKRTYEKVVVMGLSQGGCVAILNGLQTSPTAVVVSSPSIPTPGIYAHHQSFDNLVIPGIYEALDVNTFAPKIGAQKSLWLFTYGKMETGVFRREVEEGEVAKLLSPYPNISYRIHREGHEFPIPEIEGFLKPIIGHRD